MPSTCVDSNDVNRLFSLPQNYETIILEYYGYKN